MSTATRSKLWPAPTMPPEPAYPLTVEQYLGMVEAGLITEDNNVELLEGWVLPKMAQNPPHAVIVDLLPDVIAPVLPSGWCLRSQNSARLSDSVPEPDGAVVRGKKRDYLKGHPQPKDVGLSIEVADATLERDRGLKQRIYARARIPIYWIINLRDNVVEVYTGPGGTGLRAAYKDCTVYEAGESIPLVLDSKTVARIPVRDLLP